MLYDVYIVDPEAEKVIFHKPGVIAKDETLAKMIAFKDCPLEKPIDEYDFICHPLGNVRPKKEMQEVKIIKE